MATGTI